MDNHTLIKWPNKPFSGRFVYKSNNQWHWQCDMCYGYETDITRWSDAVSSALNHAYLCPNVNSLNRSYEHRLMDWITDGNY